MEKAWFYERFLFEVVMVMVKDKKIQYKTRNLNKISFMHYMKLTRVMSQVVFEEFELVHVFFPIFFFFFNIIQNW